MHDSRSPVRALVVALALAGLAASAASAASDARTKEFLANWDARLDERAAQGDRAAVLDGVDEILLRLPAAPLAGLWLAAVLAEEGAVEDADALVARLPASPPDTAAARTIARQRERLRDVDLLVIGDANVTFDDARRRAVEGAVTAWMKEWTAATGPVSERAGDAGVLARARTMVATHFPNKAKDARPSGRWSPEGFRIHFVVDRLRPPPPLAIDVGIGAAAVSSDELAALTGPLTLRVAPTVSFAFAAAEPEERLDVNGRAVPLDEAGRSATVTVPRGSRVRRVLGRLERVDDIPSSPAGRVVALEPWPLLARADEVFVSPLSAPLTREMASLLDELCREAVGAHVDRIVDGVIGARGFIVELVGLDDETVVTTAEGLPAPLFRCRGRAFLGVGSSSTGSATQFGLGAKRTFAVDVAAREAGRIDIASKVILRGADERGRWRFVGGEAWSPLSTPVIVPTSADDVAVEYELPTRQRQSVRVTAPTGATVEFDVETPPLRADWQAWNGGSGERTVFFASLAVPVAIGATAAGLALVGKGADDEANVALIDYHKTRNLETAADLRDVVEEKGATANLFAGAALGTAGIAVLSLAVPAWFWLQAAHSGSEPPLFEDDAPTAAETP